MADNFNLRKFLTENKLTKNAKLLKEEVSLNGKPINTRSIEIDGIDTEDYPDFVDAYITYAEYEDGTPLSDEELMSLEDENYGLTGELIHDRQLYLEVKKQASSGDMAYTEKAEEGVSEGGYDDSEEVGDVYEEAIRNVLGVNAKEEVVMNIYDKMYDAGIIKGTTTIDSAEQEVRSWIKANSSVMESKTSAREKYLTRLVENALGIAPQQIPMAEEEMVQEKPLPKYENIEKLMQEIEHGTNEAAYKHKMAKMKEVAEMLEARVGSLEEGEGAEFVDTKKVKQMKKDIMTLRKQAEKLEKEYDKKFGEKKSKKETQTESKLENFNLKKFLIENKLTANSRILAEEFAPSTAPIQGIEDATYPVGEAFKKAGVDMSKPVIVIHSETGNPVKQDPSRIVSKLEKLRQEYSEEFEEGDDFPVFYEYDNNTVLASEMPEGTSYKLAVGFFEAEDFSILQ